MGDAPINMETLEALTHFRKILLVVLNSQQFFFTGFGSDAHGQNSTKAAGTNSSHDVTYFVSCPFYLWIK
jgi:hypothetical protein